MPQNALEFYWKRNPFVYQGAVNVILIEEQSHLMIRSEITSLNADISKSFRPIYSPVMSFYLIFFVCLSFCILTFFLDCLLLIVWRCSHLINCILSETPVYSAYYFFNELLPFINVLTAFSWMKWRFWVEKWRNEWQINLLMFFSLSTFPDLGQHSTIVAGWKQRRSIFWWKFCCFITSSLRFNKRRWPPTQF